MSDVLGMYFHKPLAAGDWCKVVSTTHHGSLPSFVTVDNHGNVNHWPQQYVSDILSAPFFKPGMLVYKLDDRNVHYRLGQRLGPESKWPTQRYTGWRIYTVPSEVPVLVLEDDLIQGFAIIEQPEAVEEPPAYYWKNRFETLKKHCEAVEKAAGERRRRLCELADKARELYAVVSGAEVDSKPGEWDL